MRTQQTAAPQNQTALAGQASSTTASPCKAPVVFTPHRFREREYEAQVAGKCIGHIWKYDKAWSVRIGEHFATCTTLRAASAKARELAKR